MLYNTISNLCATKGITGYRMCKETGIQPSVLTDLKMGRKESISAKNADKIARFFGVPVGYLLGTVTLNEDGYTFSDGTGFGGGSAVGAGFENGSGYGGPILRGNTSFERSVEICDMFGIDFQELCDALDIEDAAVDHWKNGGKPIDAILQEIEKRTIIPIPFITGKEKTPEEPELNEGEKLLIQLFRQVPPDRQKLILDTVRAFADQL